MDESASRLRIEIDSMPDEIDQLARRRRQLEIERQALRMEEDAASLDRLGSTDTEIADLTADIESMGAQWELEKHAIGEVSRLRLEIDGIRSLAEVAERDEDLASAAELRYGIINDLSAQLAEREGALAALHTEGTMLSEAVTEADVADVVARWTGIPVARLMQGESEKLIRLEDRLHRRVVGQDPAVSAVARAVRRSRAGLSDPNRPVGTFLFLGPSGVGKTEVARALAEFLFDDERSITRIDMSEYMEKYSVSRLIGAPPGYIGYDEGGQLTEAVRRRPYSVILLDEIEKADPEVFNVLLQILDDGRLTDGQGRTVDFTSSVVIMTSNLGSELILPELPREVVSDRVLGLVRNTFRPEFLNRIDEIVVFERLTQEDIRRIVEIQLEGLKGRVSGRGLDIVIDDAAVNLIAQLGYDPAYGARPLRRLLQRELVDRVATALIEGRYTEGDTIRVGADREALLLS
jgi:ATP-dependent Clp protease ATP-binding subunit ClpB